MLHAMFVRLGLSPRNSNVLATTFILTVVVIPCTTSLDTRFVGVIPSSLGRKTCTVKTAHTRMVGEIVFPVTNSNVFSTCVLTVKHTLKRAVAIAVLVKGAGRVPSALHAANGAVTDVVTGRFNRTSNLGLSSLVTVNLLLFLVATVVGVVKGVLVHHTHRIWSTGGVYTCIV